MIRSIDNELADILIADTVFVGFLAQYLHACAVNEYCKNMDIHLLIGNLSKDFYDPDWRRISNAFIWKRKNIKIHIKIIRILFYSAIKKYKYK